MKKAEEEADLVIVIGTSLSGLNADKIAINPAKKSLSGKSLGTVIINMQQTMCDGSATLRIFTQADKFFEAIMTHLALDLNSVTRNFGETRTKALVPYDKHGRKSDDQFMWLGKI